MAGPRLKKNNLCFIARIIIDSDNDAVSFRQEVDE